MTTQREIKNLIEAAEAKHPGFHITSAPGKGQLKGLTIFHVTHQETGLETSRDSATIGGAVWCIEHFEEIRTDPRFWSKPNGQ